MIDVINTSCEDFTLLNDLLFLMREARDAENSIINTFGPIFNSTGAKKLQVVIIHGPNGYQGEGYLSADRYYYYYDNVSGGREYVFWCTYEGIYRMFRSCYLIRNNMADMNPVEYNCKIENFDEFFRKFIQSTKEAEDSANKQDS